MKFIRNTAKKILQLFAAPKSYIGNSKLNKLGLQENRINRFLMRQKKNESYSNPKFSKDEKILDRDGLLIISNFFSDKIFVKIKEEIKAFKASEGLLDFPNKQGFGVDWKAGNPSAIMCPTIHKYFRSNNRIHELVRHTTNRKVKFLPYVSYEHLTLPLNQNDNKDPNRVLHADRYYPTIKAVLYLDDVTEANGPFYYSRGSHHLDKQRIEFETKSSYFQALLKEGKTSQVPENWIKNNRIHPPADLYSNYKSTPIIGKANTLAVINTCGFHNRGEMQPQNSREAIRLVFHYVYSPSFIQSLFNLFKLSPGRWLN
jgi:hypothetical protein